MLLHRLAARSHRGHFGALAFRARVSRAASPSICIARLSLAHRTRPRGAESSRRQLRRKGRSLLTTVPRLTPRGSVAGLVPRNSWVARVHPQSCHL